MRAGIPNVGDGSEGYLILLLDADYNRISNNTIQRGVHDNIGLWPGANYNEVYNNTFTNAMGYQFFPNANADRNIAHGNIMTGSDVDLSYMKSPVLMNAGADNNIVRYNEMYDNERMAVNFTSSGAAITGNNISGCITFGMTNM